MIEFKLDKQSPVPFYRQIVDVVLASLSGGAILPGERLPTIRELAVKLEVNPNTVVKAYSNLQLMGILDTQQGSGVFVRAQPASSLSQAERERSLEALCRDFAGRAHLLGIRVGEVIECLRRMQDRTEGTEPPT